MGSQSADGAAAEEAPLGRSLSGAEAREARKRRLEDQGKAAREARKQRLDKEKEAEDLRLRKIALARERRLAGGTLTEEVAEDKQAEAADAAEEEARLERLREKVAARKAAQEKERADAEAAAAAKVAEAKAAAEAAEAAKVQAEFDAKGEAPPTVLPSVLPDSVAKLMSRRDEDESEDSASSADKEPQEDQKEKMKTKEERKRREAEKKLEMAKKEEKQKKKEKKKKKKKKKASSSSSSGRSPSPLTCHMLKQMAIQEQASFAWEKEQPKKQDNEQDAAALRAALSVPSATPTEVEDFINLCGGIGRGRIDPEAAIRLRELPATLQRLVLDRGPIGNSQFPSRVLLARIRQAEEGGLGKVGDAAPAENPAIEALITKHEIDKNCAIRLRYISPLHQKVVLSLDLSKSTNHSGLIMSRLNELGARSA